MVKRYKIVKLEEEVHQNLVRLRALHELQTGKRVTISELIEDMISREPTYQITAEEIESKPQA
ncbi:MAG: hypothetical protein QW587_04720 [Candidatus Bathyarchaeia archaeon]